MSNNYVSNKKENIINVFFSHLPKVAFFSSFFSVVFILLYLKRISMLEIFVQMDISVYVLAFIFVFFAIVVFYIIFPHAYSAEFIFKEVKQSSTLRVKLFLSVIEISIILPFASILFYYTGATNFLKIFIFVISFTLVVGCVFIFSSLTIQDKEYIKQFWFPCFITSFLFFCAFLFIVIMSSDDNDAIKFVMLYSLFLVVNNSRYIFCNEAKLLCRKIPDVYNEAKLSWEANYNEFKYHKAKLLCRVLRDAFKSKSKDKLLWVMIRDAIHDFKYNKPNENNKYHRCISVFLGITVLIISVDGFNMQRAILQFGGMAQDSSLSAWYLVKNRDMLDSFTTRDYLVKYNKNIDDRENYYINGYLIFNIGNVRVICPHDFESEDNQRSNNQGLAFSRCLSLTSEDIKFVKRDFPKNNGSVAVMVAKTVMKIEKIMIVKNTNSCKKTENSKN